MLMYIDDTHPAMSKLEAQNVSGMILELPKSIAARATAPAVLRDVWRYTGSHASTLLSRRLVIDIDPLNEAELRDLNRRIIERLRFLQQMRAHATMLKFSVGERVWFRPDGREPIFSVITKYNRKTVTVQTGEGGWRVGPSALRKAATAPDLASYDRLLISQET